MNLEIKYKILIIYFISNLLSANSACGKNQACKLFFHLTSTNPNIEELKKVESDISAHGIEKAAENITTDIKEFQTVQLKTFAEPWTHPDHLTGSTLNDTLLTIIKAVSKEIDFRRILWDDIIAVANGEPTSNTSRIRVNTGDIITSFYRASNNHYQDLENKDIFYHESFISFLSQSPIVHQEKNAAAGILSTGGFGRAAYTAGTNRRALKMLYKMGACYDLEELRDATSPENKIMRDILVKDSDGTVTTFKNLCKTCHGALIDPIVPAFAYYDVSANAISYKATDPIPNTNKLMKVVYANGYIPKNDQWEAIFTINQRKIMGWPTENITGFGAKSFGQAFANSEAFASCQPKRAFETVCFREAKNDADIKFISELKDDFKSNNFNLKRSFIKSAIYCSREGL